MCLDGERSKILLISAHHIWAGLMKKTCLVDKTHIFRPPPCVPNAPQGSPAGIFGHMMRLVAVLLTFCITSCEWL